MLRIVLLLGVVAGCSDHGSRPAVVPDGTPPDVFCPTSTVFTPVAVSGSSPGGSLDVFRFASAGFVTGFCPDAYLINFTPSQLDPTCVLAPWLQLTIAAPFTATGTNQATATLPDVTGAFTDKVTFEATQLDPPDATPPHIIGHFVSHDPAWSFDIPVDLLSRSSTTCI